MNKKLTVVILSVLMLFSMCLSLTACGEEEIKPQHTHEFSTEWTYDDTYHWHKCIGEGCAEIKDKATHNYVNGVCVCGKEEPAPSADYTVTKEEWNNALGLDKPFFFADNYKLTMQNVTGAEESSLSLTVDGFKVKGNMVSGSYNYTEYCSYENGKYYVFDNYKGVWEKEEYESGNPIYDVIEQGIYPIMIENAIFAFTYDEVTHTYNAYDMFVDGITLKSVSVKFENKKITEVNYVIDSISMTNTTTIVYGGQSVELPEVSLLPTGEQVSETEWKTAFGDDYPFFFAENYKVTTIMTMEQMQSSEIFEIDGFKAKETATDGLRIEEHYYLYDNDNESYFMYSKNGSNWERIENYSNPILGLLIFMAPFSDTYYDDFIYNTTTNAFECDSITVNNHTFTDLSIKFANKKITEISFNSVRPVSETENAPFHMSITFEYDGQSVEIPELAPSSTKNIVTEQEWADAFNKDKPFGFDDNYKMTENMSAEYGGQLYTAQTIIYVDGNKMKMEDVYDGGFTDVVFISYEEGKYYMHAEEKREISWNSNLAKFASNFSSFTYDEDTDSYICSSFDADDKVTCFDIVMKFENKKLVYYSHSHYEDSVVVNVEGTVTYGGQTVELPQF